MFVSFKSKLNQMFCAMFLLLAVLMLCGCGQTAQNDRTSNTDSKEYDAESECQFADDKDIVLLLGISGQDSAPLEIVGKNYTLEFDKSVVNVLNNKVVAVGAGVCALKLKFTVDGNELVDTKTVKVKTPVFCGDVYIQPRYVFALNGPSKIVELKKLNDGYMFDVEYFTASLNFEVNNLGCVKPVGCGNGTLYVSLVSGVDENHNLVYKTLEAEIVVVNPSAKPTLCLLDDNKVELVGNNDVYTIYSNPLGISYYLKLNTYDILPETIDCVIANTSAEDNLVSDNPLIYLSKQTTEQNFVYQKFTVCDAGTISVSMTLHFKAFNLEESFCSNEIKLIVYRQTTNFELTAYCVESNSIIADDSFNLYLFNEDFTTSANNDGLFKNAYVEFCTNDFTDGVIDIDITSDTEVEARGDGFVIIPTRTQTINFVLTGSYGGFTKTFCVKVLECLPKNVEFYLPNSEDLNINIDQTLNVAPVISPVYALCNTEYVYSTDIFEIEDGVLLPKTDGKAVLTIKAGDSTKTYNVHIVDNNPKIYVTSISSTTEGLVVCYKIYASNESEYTNYQQDVAITFYDADGNLMTNYADYLEVQKFNNTIEIFMAPGTQCFMVLSSPVYDISTQRFCLSNN